MDKKEIFALVMETTADVCEVTQEEMVGGSRREDVVLARSISVFWLIEAGFSVECIRKCAGIKSASHINAIKSKIEWMWTNIYAYHLLLKEVGFRLKLVAEEHGEEFNFDRPINHIRKTTGMY